MRMRRIVSLLMAVVLLLALALPAAATTATSNAPNRVINLVYDDSGSMIEINGELVDTWCQAKYAIEVFAALLGQKDTLNIYVMSDYSKPKLTLRGQDGSGVNVGKVHNMLTAAGDTPFQAVKAAYNNLTTKKADEKWLVVLTDGIFQGEKNIDSYFAKKSKDINVMFLGMGPYADGITENEADNIFYREAKTSQDILREITKISTQIFNSHRLEVSVSSKTFSFDVPMSELVVFAQGANVKINGIKAEGGKTFSSSTVPVAVRFSEKPATNHEKFIVARDLLGSVATFRDDFPAGKYTVDVEGAQTIEVYYKPNVEIAAYLKNTEGKEVTDLTDLESGEYTIEFGFVKAGTAEKVTQSKLLGNVTYEAKVTNNGIVHDKSYGSGDRIKLTEGSLSISVTARYLDYNTVSTQLSYTVFKNKAITYEVVESPDYIIRSEGFAEIKPIVIKATIDGKAFTQEQWKAVGLPTVNLSEEQDFKMGDFKVEKSEEPGVFRIYPSLAEATPSSGTYADCNIKIEYKGKHGSETWSGTTEVPVKMQDTRAWIERNRDLVIKLAVLAVVLFFVIGYMPFVKPYLPKSLKRMPHVKGVPEGLGVIKDKNSKGLVQKKFCSTIVPYVAQRGTIRYVSQSTSGAPLLKVKAIKNRRMTIVNLKSFAGREDITFNGSTIPRDCKEYKMSASVQIKFRRNGWVYHCVPNKGEK